MPDGKIQTLMGFAAGHQTPQRPDRKSRTVITKLVSHINVESTTMILCLKRRMFFSRIIQTENSVTVSLGREDLEIKRTQFFVEMEDNLNSSFLEVKLYCKE